MPREQVIQPTVHVYDKKKNKIDEGRPSHVKTVPEGGSMRAESGLAVHWNPSMRMQISATVHVDTLRGILKSIDEGEMETSDGYYGIYMDVSRYEANQLIKTVRRARNATFGSDE